MMSELITLHAARHICSEHDKYCTDPANRQYDSTNDCLNFLVYNRTFGEPFELGQDTTGCRYMHTAMLKYRPYEHCPHVGVSNESSFAIGAHVRRQDVSGQELQSER